MNKKVGFISLGCSKNLVDTEIMMGILQKSGYTLIPEDALEEAEIIVINTCTFIESAKEESVNTILQAAEYKKTGKCERLIAAGCLSQQFREDLAKEIPEIDVLIGTNSWQHIAEAIDESYAENDRNKVAFFDAAPCMNLDEFPRLPATPSWTAYLKIAEGCSNGCTFCYIPYVRGPMRSRPVASVLREAARLAASGIREINIIAQDTSCYGRDLKDGTSLAGLLRELVKIEGIHWIRLFYLYPTYFTDELLTLICSEPKICNYVDIPLQHISDSVLQRMNRKDRKADILLLLRKLRSAPERVTLRTTLMVGFPGETEDDFRQLCDFVKEIKFDALGIFKYSPEDGTPAAKMENQVPEEIKEDRYHQLMSIQAAISEENNTAYIGKTAEALIEEVTEEGNHLMVKGRTSFQAPEVDGSVYIENPGTAVPGDFIKIRITDGYAYDLVAERIQG